MESQIPQASEEEKQFATRTLVCLCPHVGQGPVPRLETGVSCGRR
jgi:hypothetical protein